MSLSALLLGKPKKVDSELDALFKSNPIPPQNSSIPATSTQPPTKKRKIQESHGEKNTKRAKSGSPIKLPVETKPTKSSKKPRKSPTPVPQSSPEPDDSEDDNDDLENAYLLKSQKRQPDQSNREDSNNSDAGGSEVEVDDESDAPPPTHESLLSSAKRVRVKTSKKKDKFVPEDESAAQRNARTLFVGGLPVEVAEKKSLKKQLSRHILSFLPPPSQGKIKIESVRFRSVAYQKPSNGPTSNKDGSKPAPNANASEHSKSRAAKWRDDATKEEEKPKEYLTPAQKKKVMFIKGEFHSEGRGVNAYVVLAHPVQRDNDVDMDGSDPYNAALEIARAANFSSFLDVAIRVDVCGQQQPNSNSQSNLDAIGATGDPKFSLFIGNLEFGSQERDVMEFFEGVVAGERGPAPDSANDETKQAARWVQSVRLIRDPETQLGKGFGYVRFSDRECVDEVLSLSKTDEGKKKLKFAKRVLRVQRCRATTTKSTSSKPASDSVVQPIISPTSKTTKRGDPTLGERLVHLGKEERKAAKKADKDRESRRAEKKMRMRMKVKSQVPGGFGGKGAGKSSVKSKERERIRKVKK